MFRYYGDLVRNLANARNASFCLILILRLVSKIILILGGINIIGFRANIIVVNITIIKEKIRFLLMLGTLWQHVLKPYIFRWGVFKFE